VHSYTFFHEFCRYWAAIRSVSIAIGSIRNELDLDLVKEKPILGRMSASLPRFQISNSHAAVRRIESHRWFKTKTAFGRAKRTGFGSLSYLAIQHNLSSSDSWEWELSYSTNDGIDFYADWQATLIRTGIRARIQIAGDGPLRSKLESMANDLGVAVQNAIPGAIVRISPRFSRMQGYGSRFGWRGYSERCHGSDGCWSSGGRDGCWRRVAGRPGRQDGIRGALRRFGSATTDSSEPLLTDDGLAIRMGQSAMEYATREFSLSRLVQDTFQPTVLPGGRPVTHRK
jgi:PAS domain-containing protein